MPRRLKPQKRKVSSLKHFPMQREYFGDTDDQSIEELAADIDEFGLRDPIVILSDGTIISGHRRLAAVILLGWKEVPVIVRDDLDDDVSAQFHEFLRENMSRRHLSNLELAKCYIAMDNVVPEMAVENYGNCRRPNYRAILAKYLRCSERNADRYRMATLAPIEVQAAFERGEIKLTDAARAGGLSDDAKAAVAHRIQNGEAAKEVLAEFLSCSARTGNRSMANGLLTFIGALRNALQNQTFCEQDLPDIAAAESYTQLFKDAKKLLTRLECWNKAALKRRPCDEGLLQLLQPRASRMNEEVL